MPRRCQRTRSECIWAAVEAGCSGLSGTCHQNMFLGDFFRTLLCHNLIFPNHLNISPFIFSLFSYPKNNNFLLFLSIFCFTTISKPTLLFGFFTYPTIFLIQLSMCYQNLSICSQKHDPYNYLHVFNTTSS